MKNEVDACISSLTKLRDQIAQLDDIKSELDGAKSDLTAVKADLKTAKEELVKAQSGISVSQMKNVKEYEEAVFEKRKTYEGLMGEIESAKIKLAEIEANTNSAKIHYSEIIASLESLRKKIA